MAATASGMPRRLCVVFLAFCILIAPPFHSLATTTKDDVFFNNAPPSQQLEDPNYTQGKHSFELRTRLSVVKARRREGAEEDYRTLPLARLDRDSARVRFLQTPAASAEPPVTLGLTNDQGMYWAKIGLGTPVQEFDLVVDTLSHMTWVQCLSSADESINLNHSAGIFNYSQSTTYSQLVLSNETCPNWIYPPSNETMTTPCAYAYRPESIGPSNNEGLSYTEGVMATESITLGGKSVSPEKLVFGCAYRNFGERTSGAAGALGFGPGPYLSPLALHSQLNLSSFSYCLTNPDSASPSTSTLVLGSPVTQTPPSGVAVAASLLNDDNNNDHYYFDLVGIRVGGGRMINISTGNKGGVVMDTVTTITRLEPDVYTSLRDYFFLSVSRVLPAANFSTLGTCFHLSAESSIDALPTVSFHFASSEKDLELPANNSLFRVDDAAGTYYCLAFTSSEPDSQFSTIIGSHQQQGMQVTYDLPNSRVVFLPGQC